MNQREIKRTSRIGWRGTSRPVDTSDENSRRKVAVIGVDRVGSEVVSSLTGFHVNQKSSIIVGTSPPMERILQTAPVLLVDCTSVVEKRERETILRKVLTDTDFAFVVTELGDKSKLETAWNIANIAQESGSITIAVVQMPDQQVELHESASHLLLGFQQRFDTVLIVDRRDFSRGKSGYMAKEVSNLVNRKVISTLKSMIEATSAPNLIDRDVEALTSIVRHGGIAAVGISESEAAIPLESALQNALKSQLADVDLSHPKDVLIHVNGNCQMTKEEIGQVEENLSEILSESERVVWSRGISPGLKDKTRVTVMITGVSLPSSRKDLSSIVPMLFNMEPYSEYDKGLPVDFGLDQLESF